LRDTLSPGAIAGRLRPAVLCAALACGQAAGDAALQFGIARVDGAGWGAQGITIDLQRDDAGRLGGRISAARLELPPPIGPRDSVHGACLDLVVTARRFSCNELVLELPDATPTGLRLTGRLDYRRDTGALAWDFALPADGDGELRFGGRLDDGGWTVDLKASRWPVEAFEKLGGLFGLALPAAAAGRIDLSLFARGRDTDLGGLVFELAGAALAGGNEAGTLAMEGVDVELRGSAWPDGDRLAFEVRGGATAGEAYLEPVYVNLETHPARLVVRGHADERNVSISQLILDQHATVHADASAEIGRDADDTWRIRSARVRLPQAEMPGTYTVLLQPFLAATPLAKLETSGRLRGELTVRDGALEEVRLELEEVNVDDQDALLAIYGLSGELAWLPARDEAVSARARPLQLRWSGGFVYGIPFGAAQVHLDARGDRWALSQPVSLPLLDGTLEIDTLEFGDFTAGDDALLFDAHLTPVSMRELSRALDWPPLSGQLSGALPQLSHADGVLALGGELTAEVFSGIVAIRELRIQRPLQPRARLQAEVELQGLELAELTEALSFGLMTGRLDGYVRGLEMIDWAPVAFDARLYTAAGDRTRKRISQRAVDNIANLGGGGAGVLSTGFLRFFEDFSYDAFALGCRLERDVCEMYGLEDRDQGYVILRGRGLPRIDVMGFARRVSWSALVEQLASILDSEGPEIR
jgi:hypothetical protein